MLYPDFHELVALKKFKPKLIHSSRSSVKSSVAGGKTSAFRGRGLEFDSVREYVPGDDIRNIDWRVTARTGSPHLKLFKEEKQRDLILCVDVNSKMKFGTKNTFKSVQAARIAALLGWTGIAQKDRVSGCLFGEISGGIRFFSPQKTQKSFYSLLKALSEPSDQLNKISLEEAFFSLYQEVHPGSLVYVISDFMDLDEKIEENLYLKQLRKKCDVVFIAVNDLSDKTLYPFGLLGFSSQKGDLVYCNTQSLSGRKAYEEQWDLIQNRLDSIGSKLKIPIIRLTTESEPFRDLMWGLKKIAKVK